MIRVSRSTIIEAPVDAVWAVLRDFNSHERWHPAVAASQIEQRRASDEVGCVRDFRLAEGGAGLREQLLAVSDRDFTLTYCILDAPFPLEGYVATIRLKPVTDGDRTFWSWESRFSAPPDRAEELKQLVGEGIYEAGFAAVRSLFARNARTPHAPAAGVTVHRPAPIAGRSGQTLHCNAVVLEAYGGPDRLHWRQIEVPPPGRGEVRLRHTAIGVNFIDIYCRTGYFDLVRPPGILGMEAAGVVLDVGEGISDIAPGDRIGYACRPVGAYTELRTMSADLLVPLPADLSDEVAASVLLKGMSAEFLLQRVHRLREGETVLVHAAAGGVGQLLCQWASALGAHVIGVVGSREKAWIAREAGCAYVIISTEEDFAAHVRQLTDGHGADVIYDAVGRDSFGKSYEALATRGHLVSFGQASGPISPIDIAGYASKSATVSRPNYGHYTDTPQKVRSITANLFRAIRNGTVRPAIDRRLPLRDAAQAHRALESRETAGAIVLLPE
jgi:NADPH:quinone reductase